MKQLDLTQQELNLLAFLVRRKKQDIDRLYAASRNTTDQRNLLDTSQELVALGNKIKAALDVNQ